MEEQLAERIAEQSEGTGDKRAYLLIKRGFDVAAALIGLLICALPMVLIAILIRVSSKGPPVLRQERFGQHRRTFVMYKFRTMYCYAPDNVATSLLEHADDYITPLGRILRKTSLDELPQLLNVLKGDMSLVGFRPTCLSEKNLDALRAERGVYVSKPGITGLAQVRGRDNLHYKEKARVDAEYVHNRSVKLDLYCLLKTVWVAVTQEGAK